MARLRCVLGGDMEMLEERDRQVFPRPRAASSSAAAFPFVSGVSAFVWDGIQKIGKSLFDFTFRQGG